MLKFSILDYAPLDEGTTGPEAIQNTVHLAKRAEALGFHRFWVAEHHDVPAFASSSPEMLMMHLADQTDHIRIGSGGVMIPHYSPLKIAENMQMLNACHPGRIDLGMGNTTGTEVVNEALNEHKKQKPSYQKHIEDIKHYLLPEEAEGEDYRFGQLRANPQADTAPDFWLLSTSVSNAKLAAKEGLGYCFGLFPWGRDDKYVTGPEAIKTYQEKFQPHTGQQKAGTMVAVFAVVAETPEEALDLGQAVHLWLLGQDQFSYFKHLPTVAEAKAYDYTDKEKAHMKANEDRVIIAHRGNVKEKMQALAEHFGTEEILLCLLSPGIDKRQAGLEILAEEFDLQG